MIFRVVRVQGSGVKAQGLGLYRDSRIGIYRLHSADGRKVL